MVVGCVGAGTDVDRTVSLEQLELLGRFQGHLGRMAQARSGWRDEVVSPDTIGFLDSADIHRQYRRAPQRFLPHAVTSCAYKRIVECCLYLPLLQRCQCGLVVDGHCGFSFTGKCTCGKEASDLD